MKIVVALTSFKGSISALNACRAVAKGIRQVIPEAAVTLLPISDGGDDFFECIAARWPVSRATLKVTGPLGEPIESEYLTWRKSDEGKVGLIEVAKVCGLTLVPQNQRNPMQTTSYGLGQMLRHLLRRRVKTIYVGLGGTATQDGGSGMAQALGFKLLDNHKKPIGFGCGWIGALNQIDDAGRDTRLRRVKIIALSDVQNPLLGDNGSAKVYAAQKGATPVQVEAAEENMGHLAAMIEKYLHVNVTNIEGAGAAGGIGAGLAAFCEAKILPGTETILTFLKADEVMAQADCVIVGEGKLDAQSLMGKAPQGVAMLAKSLDKRVVGLFGQIDSTVENLPEKLGLSSWMSLLELGVSSQEAQRQAAALLSKAANKLFSNDLVVI